MGSSETNETECSPQRFSRGTILVGKVGTILKHFSLVVPLPTVSPHLANTPSKNIEILTPFSIAALDRENTSTDELFKL